MKKEKQTIPLPNEEKSTSKNQTNPEKRAPLKLLTIPIITTLIGFISYWAPYVTGLTYYQTLLSAQNIPFHLFERQSSDYFIYAHYAFIEASSSWISLIFKDTKIFLFIMGAFAALGLEFFILNWLSNCKKSKQLVTKLDSNNLLSIPLAILLLAFLAAFLITFSPVLILIILIIPGIIGEYAAEQTVKENKEIYSQGCIENKKDWHCTAVLDKNQEIFRGFLIASSNERIALFLDGRTIIFPLDDKVLVSVPPPDNTQSTSSLPENTSPQNSKTQ
ncbi:hypothetical protein [Pseudomonas indica]|uniref:Uncharacterized protein n=1 Tax=Pseudomonas indica TaxID=137658 RepID=A0A1G9HDU5_9PSED|nr:hypothetical protein [Pseudomonas indica]SDL11069.1 hypothetical protein SAMN05216186_1158 [Pseudomonas indica]